MKILVFGASGKTGRAVVEQAVAAGHQVTAFVRDATELQVLGVRVIAGDATAFADVDVAIRDQDAIIDTIGGKTPYKETTLEQSAAKQIIVSMQQNGVRRLIATSMLGVGTSEENTPFYARLLLATFLRGADKDKAAMEQAVEASDLDWIIVRPAILNDGPPTGEMQVLPEGTDEKAHKISRGDVASFMLAQVASDQYLRQAIVIANK